MNKKYHVYHENSWNKIIEHLTYIPNNSNNLMEHLIDYCVNNPNTTTKHTALREQSKQYHGTLRMYYASNPNNTMEHHIGITRIIQTIPWTISGIMWTTQTPPRNITYALHEQSKQYHGTLHRNYANNPNNTMEQQSKQHHGTSHHKYIMRTIQTTPLNML